MIFGMLLILAVAACGSTPPKEAVVEFSSYAKPSVEEARSEAPAPPSPAPVLAPAPAVTAAPPFEYYKIGKPPEVQFIGAGFAEETKPMSSGKAKSPAPATPTRREPASVGAPILAPPTGSAAYYIPRQMVEKQPSLVDLWIDRNTTVEQLKQELAAQLKITNDKINVRRVQDKGENPGVTVIAQLDGVSIPIGGTMIAELRGGDDFSIEPAGLISQTLQGVDRAKWNWRVTPKHASQTFLDLDIWIDPGPGKRLIDSYHESVNVDAIEEPTLDKIKRLLQEINTWLAIFGVSIGGVITWFMKKKNNDSKPT